MRFTRAAKVAAFPLTALILVALVACQGPAGPAGAAGGKGDPGTTGTPGTMGTPGTTGTPGVDALQARTGVGTVFFNPDELVDEAGRPVDVASDTLVGDTTTELMIDLNEYFLGGIPPYKFDFVDEDEAADVQNGLTDDAGVVVDAKIDHDTGMLVFKITVGETSNTAQYTVPVSGKIKATDTEAVSAEASVSILLNQMPQGADNTDVLVLGTMDDDRADPGLEAAPGRNMICTKINECVLDVFSDQDDFDVSVTGMTQAGKAVSGLIRSEPTDDGKIRLIGMATTWVVVEDGDDVFRPVTVKLKAVDSRGLENTASVLVDVDAAPTVTTLGRSIDGASYDVDDATGKLRLSTNAATWFDDADHADRCGYRLDGEKCWCCHGYGHRG